MLTEKPEWHALVDHKEAMNGTHMRDLFARDKHRPDNFILKHHGILLDYSKNIATEETISLLTSLARSCQVEKWRDSMFAGEAINTSKNIAVSHTSLRTPDYDHSALKNLSEKIRINKWCGHTGKPLKNIINIGIGGSSTGTEMLCDALKTTSINSITLRFVSNIDGAMISQTLNESDPEDTLFIISSKSFTTQETIENANTAKIWLIDKLGSDNAVSKHFVAISSNIEEAKKFGIDQDNILPMEEGVGGRYSLWSSIGLPVCIAIGFDNFQKLLNGAYTMDQHFCSAPLEQNMPVILALLGIWYRNFHGMECHAVCPYSHDMRLLPSWVTQLDMESNGKIIDRDGNKIFYKTGPVVIGGAGTNCQHSFFQLLHQGTTVIPCDFIATAKAPSSPLERHHRVLLSNMVAQAQALMQGNAANISNNNNHKLCEGNKPSNTIIMEELNAFNMGMLLALYEHKIFVQGIIWNLNSFDQWGVELGKSMAEGILSDSSEETLPKYLR